MLQVESQQPSVHEDTVSKHDYQSKEVERLTRGLIPLFAWHKMRDHLFPDLNGLCTNHGNQLRSTNANWGLQQNMQVHLQMGH